MWSPAFRLPGVNAAMHDLVFLFDVDNTLLDNDHVQRDLSEHLPTTMVRGTGPLLEAV